MDVPDNRVDGYRHNLADAADNLGATDNRQSGCLRNFAGATDNRIDGYHHNLADAADHCRLKQPQSLPGGILRQPACLPEHDQRYIAGAMI